MSQNLKMHAFEIHPCFSLIILQCWCCFLWAGGLNLIFQWDKKVFNSRIRKLCTFRSKDVEWVNFLTTRFVDDITNHLKIYHKAKQRVEKSEGGNLLSVVKTTLL